MDRTGSLARYAALPATEREAESVARTFREAFGVEGRQLGGSGVTKTALAQSLSGVRYLHVATHGYFSDANVRVAGELEESRREGDGLWQRESLGSRVEGMTPMALCGLALAGANRGADSKGRVAGILTAEELAGLDLRACELAVLSACETNVGIRRAGLGIASLQAALHAAGARTAITSLWKVPDEATRELFADFYRRLWVEKKPAARALWEAKKALRARGAPTRDWAAWVLTGDPGDEPARPASGPSAR
jgi:CHAT domain-containing protein